VGGVQGLIFIMAKSPAFQFYPDAWLGSSNILCMTPEAEGAYIHLLCVEWNTDDCSLPDNDEELANLSRLVEKWFNHKDKILKNFIRKVGKLYNERLLKEREKQAKWREKSSLAGKLSAEKRAKGGGNSKVGSSLVQPKGNTQSQSISLLTQSQDSISTPSECYETPTKIMEDFKISFTKKNDRYKTLVGAVTARWNIPDSQVNAEIEKFINYWTEKTRDGKKERWQTEKTFEVQRRLTTWFLNANKFVAKQQQRGGLGRIS